MTPEIGWVKTKSGWREVQVIDRAEIPMRQVARVFFGRVILCKRARWIDSDTILKEKPKSDFMLAREQRKAECAKEREQRKAERAKIKADFEAQVRQHVTGEWQKLADVAQKFNQWPAVAMYSRLLGWVDFRTENKHCEVRLM